jgi:hypothetical protein
MSNAGRPRTGLKQCSKCRSTSRDSNGQCHCRNVLYRLKARAAKKDQPKIAALYDDTLASTKGKVDRAVAAVREEFPSLAKPRKARKGLDAEVSHKGKQVGRRTAAQKKAAVAEAEGVIDAAKAKAAERAAAAEALAAAPVEHGLRPVVDDSYDGDKYECVCGFQGKNSAPSVRAHVAREKRLAEQAA